MKLERLVFSWNADARWMDSYERALFNCRLGTQNAAGLKQYFVPLAAGYWRAYNTPEESFWCCTGTGAEEFAKFADTVYFSRGDDLYVNQFLASSVDWKESGLSIEQLTTFPAEPRTTLKVKSSSPISRTIHIRIPGWTTSEAEITINGQALQAVADPGSYLAIRRIWRDGDTVGINLPMKLRTEPLPGDDSVRAALYGPMVLAADLGAGPTEEGSRYLHDPFPAHIPPADPLPKIVASSDAKPAQWIQATSSSGLHFRAEGENSKFGVMPLYQIQNQRYSVYWRL
jgi:hypothetical protein